MSIQSKRAVIAGHICLDLTPIFPQGNGDGLSNMLSPGKLFNVEQADIHTGGVVANTGLAMKKFGIDVCLIGKVAEDHLGNIVLNILDKYGAARNIITTENTSTSYSIVISPPGVDRTFFHNSGANDTFLANDITDKMLQDITLFHFGYPPLMRQMHLNGGKELIKLFKRVKENNIVTSLDMAAIDPRSDAAKSNWTKILEGIMQYVDLFLPSIEELGYMLDRDRYESWIKKANGEDITTILSIKEDIEPLADRLMDMGAKVILIKCGASGMYYRTANKDKLRGFCTRLGLDLECWKDQSGFEKSYVPDKVLSGTGAGDTSIAAFLSSILKEYTLQQSLQFATATGASCVSGYDALSGLKSFEELEEKMNNGWEKV